MKKPLRLSLRHVAVLCLAISAYSCTKDTKTPAPPAKKTNTELLTQATWKIGTFEVKQADGTWTALPLTDFQKSLRTTYGTDFTVTYVSASNLGGTNTVTATWSFANNEATLVITGKDGTTGSSDIAVLTETAFQEKAYEGPFPYPGPNGTTIHYFGSRTTMSH